MVLKLFEFNKILLVHIMTANEPARTVVLNEKDSENPIVSILYGYPDKPVEWPHMTHLDLPANYGDVTNSMFKHIKNNTLTIPGGYYADHHRLAMIEDKEELTKLNILSRAIYKEFVIVRKNGEKTHYGKWITVIINF